MKQLSGVRDNSAIANLVTPETEKKAGRIHAVEKAEDIARRIKDPAALEGALIAKLEYQRDFAGEYQAKFPHGGDRSKEQDAISGVLLAARETWCQAHGFALRTVQRWCELLEESIFIDKKNGVFKKCWELAELWQAANYMSESVEWYTPARYFEAVRETLGEIDLDPASNAMANATVGAKHFFTKQDNGLDLDWYGNIFLNPPYGKTDSGKSLAGEFCLKAVSEYDAGNITAGIILINSLHSQSWQAPLYRHIICFVDHRIQFVSGDGELNKNPTFQNIFVYLGTEPHRFASAFSSVGYVMRRMNDEFGL